MQDRLAVLLEHFELRARLFHEGALCRAARFDEGEGVGYLHVLRAGRLVVERVGAQPVTLAAPCVLFYPGPLFHRLRPARGADADLVCASVAFGADVRNPLVHAVPTELVVPLEPCGALDGTLAVLFREAAEHHCGRQAIVDRLCEVVVILLFRHLMDEGLVDTGVLAGLADRRLVHALNAMHREPARAWTLAALAAEAGMSRARFAARFREVVGQTPGAYLTAWRLGLAQSLLRRGRAVKWIAGEVGYDSPASFTRAFRAALGCSPREWLRTRESAVAAGSVGVAAT